MYKILLVGDDFFSLRLTNDILRDEYEVVTFNMKSTLLDYLWKYTADLILLDYQRPEKDGLDILTALKKTPHMATIPVMVLTAQKDVFVEIACLKAGAEEFITKPFVPEVVCSRIGRILELNKLQEDLQNRLDEKTRQMENLMLQAISTIANTVDTKDDYKGDHSVLVAQYAAMIARELGWSNQDVQNIYNIGLLHDIGKISVPDMIIHKPGPLNKDEWEIMKGHTVMGAEILKDIHIVKMSNVVALHHHERYDGTGYPKGLRGEEIPIEARIVGLADAYVAMNSSRSYRDRLSTEQVYEELITGKGTQFDPYLVDILLKIIEENKLSENDIDDFVPEERLLGPAGESNQLLFKVLEANNKAVRREATRDFLTGIYNRSYAEKQISMYLRKKHQGAYIMIDLDNFKQVNDRYGHIAGDYALKSMADMLAGIAEEEAVACRMGGDEFLLFFHQEVDRERIENLAIRMLREYEKIKEGNDDIAETSISIGIAMVPEDGVHYQELYNAADKALYLSKRGGKNRYCFYNDAVATRVEEKNEVVDIHHLKGMMQIGREEKGSYQVPYREFQRIYSFVSRCVERTHQAAQLLLFSLVCENRKLDLPEEMEVEIQYLEQSIINSLRRNDISTRYSSSQILVVLVDIEDQNVATVIQRILDHYRTFQQYKQYEVKCERTAIDGQAADI